MYLHRIDLHGFKSFADRTQVQFDPGITAIVGPNGCGKSNIIDAVRWVLGEQRARLLRSEKMESVIFNGTQTRRALGMAEVSLTIHNTRGVLPTEYAEVTIGRRLFRSGESEYLLNGTTCRLKDILDLFMDTGMGAGAYSVIELKMIEDLLSESPQDRRRLFEEAAGITKYKLRRAQALRRLDQTQADLERLRDLTEEIERNVRSLARQAKKAERHKDLTSRLSELELLLAAADFTRLTQERSALTTGAEDLERQSTERTTELQVQEAEIEAQRLALVDLERERTDAQRALDARIGLIQQVETEVRLAEERRSAAGAARQRLDHEKAIDAERRITLTEETSRAEEQIQQAEQRVRETAEVEAQHAEQLHAAAEKAAEARSAAATGEKAVQEAAEALRETQRRLDSVSNRLGMLQSERSQLEEQLSQDSQLETLTQSVADADHALSESEQRRDHADRGLIELEARRTELEAAVEKHREDLAAARRTLDAARAEADVLQSLLDSYEGFSDTVQTLLQQADWSDSPRTVTDVLLAPPDLRHALDAALGSLAECVVVRTRAEAEAGIRRLADQGHGRATFLALDLLPERGPQVLSPTPPGSTPLIDLVQTAPGVPDRLARILLANCFVIDDVQQAGTLTSQYPVARLVTRSGEWSTGAIVRAGGEEKSAVSDRTGRKEQLEEAEQTMQAESGRTEQLEQAAQALVDERERQPIEAQRRELREAERAVAERGRVLGDARARLESETRRIEQLHARQEHLSREIDAAGDTSILETAVAEASREHAEAEAARARLRDELEVVEEAHRAVVGRHTEARMATAQARHHEESLRRDHERAQRSLAELDERATERDSESGRLASVTEEASTVIEEQTRKAEELRGDLEGLTAAVETVEARTLELRAAISDAETLLRDLRRLREEARDAHGNAQLRLADIQARLETLAERLAGEHGIEPDELKPADPDFDADEARDEIARLRVQIRNIGAVNELALDSYEEEKERLDFLQTQQDDLEKAETSLRSTIREINATARQRFEDTFGAVREAFQKLFVDLFGQNASADILLAGDDPLEDDIEIRARPKGKKPSAITQLSGGEKTLTAIALLFAIYLVKPSPFCILDEVDAPLDDANIERFMRLIRSFSETTQFILVTHNKLTMEAADRMYGVTMQEEGVSRLVGVRFSQVLPEAA